MDFMINFFITLLTGFSGSFGLVICTVVFGSIISIIMGLFVFILMKKIQKDRANGIDDAPLTLKQKSGYMLIMIAIFGLLVVFVETSKDITNVSKCDTFPGQLTYLNLDNTMATERFYVVRCRYKNIGHNEPYGSYVTKQYIKVK